ncbi:MAG: hypothetical protein M3N05_03415, partial [Pseudomonadota bacterium]|nr:hypothetical protein [Pseudomonadota bacterium]
ILATSGGIGMNNRLSGPADIAVQFGAYFLPLAVLEAYFRAQGPQRTSTQWSVAGLIFLMAGITALGVGGAIALMWGPYMV